MSDTQLTCTFYKKHKKSATRTKKASSSSDEEAQIIKKKSRIESNPLVQQSSKFSEKRNLQPDSDEDTDKMTVAYKADHQAIHSGPKDQGATATFELDTDKNNDAQAIFIRSQEINKEVLSNKDKIYRGVNNYAHYIEKKDTVMGNAASGFNRKGPMRAPAHLRATVRWDYQPDICKDYKETGFCSFGDSCKFLHDRSDYKHGWQIEQEVNEGTYGVDGLDDRYEIADDFDNNAEDHLPLVCFICRGPFKEPVVTKCNHYFCSACAMKRFKKTSRCYACTEDTKGSFKMAKNLLSQIAAIKAKQKPLSDVESDSEDNNKPPTQFNPFQTAINHNQEHYINSSELDSSSDEGKSTKPPISFPTLSRVEGTQPEAPEYCDSDEESD